MQTKDYMFLDKAMQAGQSKKKNKIFFKYCLSAKNVFAAYALTLTNLNELCYLISKASISNAGIGHVGSQLNIFVMLLRTCALTE